MVTLISRNYAFFSAKHDPEPAEREDCTPLDKHFNGRFLMSKVGDVFYCIITVVITWDFLSFSNQIVVKI